jgi:hypothetical protein
VGLGVENIGGGGMGPISDTGIGGSGNSDNIIFPILPTILPLPPIPVPDMMPFDR